MVLNERQQVKQHLKIMGGATHHSIQWLCIPEGEGEEMKVCFTSFHIPSPECKHELSVSPTLKNMRFSSGKARKHQPTPLFRAQPREQQPGLVWAAYGFFITTTGPPCTLTHLSV